jgi:hypothetical protein
MNMAASMINSTAARPRMAQPATRMRLMLSLGKGVPAAMFVNARRRFSSASSTHAHPEKLTTAVTKTNTRLAGRYVMYAQGSTRTVALPGTTCTKSSVRHTSAGTVAIVVTWNCCLTGWRGLTRRTAVTTNWAATRKPARTRRASRRILAGVATEPGP